ncbi:hypothetical protein WJX81_004114 [Elliptochloris bilobata]|uniref:Mei2-like C-terminal RNA recognition motif domain-containing protein n=1 Tax=Elliptochloris bilobata TaxID=381761 RepID=A0AAW1QIK5_9CHLO
MGSPGMVTHPYAWHYGGPFQVYPGGETGPPTQSSARSPGPGCMPPDSPCGPDYYCMASPMSFMPGMPVPGMGGPPMVFGPNGPMPAGMVMPHFGAPPAYSPRGGLPPRFAGGPPSPVGMRLGRVHRAADDLDKFRFSVAEARSGAPTARTTVMIKNVPNKYTQRMLLDTFDRRFRGEYDFFYLPIDYKNKCNLGYCFMNFMNAELTAECYEEFHQKRWEEFNSKKVAEVCYAKVQGCNGCIEHFKNAKFPCLDVDCLPLVFVPADAPGEPLHAVPVSPRQPPSS